MNLTSPSQVLALLQERGLQPNALLGQNFLIDANIRDIIIAAADPQSDDVVLEVGPGLGVLTEVLAGRVDRLVAVEKDRGLYEYLKERLDDHPSVTLIHGDAVDLDSSFYARQGITKLVSNLPYSVGSRVLMNAFALPSPPERITVTVQLEVAQRLVAEPGEAARGLLGVWAQSVYDVETIKVISPGCFCPKPKVKSAVVVMDRLPEMASPDILDLFREITKETFAFRRKQLGTILGRVASHFGVTHDDVGEVLVEVGLDARIRPEMLTVQQWLGLAGGIAKRNILAGARE